MKEGDIYVMSWGYDQTNNTFFRVKSLRGKTQAVVQEVSLEVENARSYTSMSGDYKYNPKKYKVDKYCVFIPDNEKGRIIKIQKEYYWEKDPEKQGQEGFRINGHFCSKYNGETLYESWYA